MTDEDLRALEHQIMDNPQAGTVMRETGGLRKIRFARPGSGKSGGYRICYVYFQHYGIVYLLLIFAKNEQPNLSAAEKSACKNLIGEIGQALNQGVRHGKE